MNKYLCTLSGIVVSAMVVLASTGCGGPAVRTVQPVAGTEKPNYKTAIQSNPNIPDSVKKKFSGPQ